MRAALAHMEREIEDGGHGVEGDRLFHAAVTAAAHSSLLAEFMRSIAGQIAESRTESLRQPHRPARSLAQHRAILDAIESGLPSRAAAAMRRHVRTVAKVRPPRLGTGRHGVGADLPGGVGRGQGADLTDPCQRHPQPAQPRHQPGLLQLGHGVVPVAGDRVDAVRPQQSQLVVEPQRLRRQPAGPGERTDRQLVLAHPLPPRSCAPMLRLPRR